MPLNNLGILTPQLFRSAQPDAEAFQSLLRLGVRHIVKLNDDQMALESAWCEEAGIQLVKQVMPQLINDVSEIMYVATLVNGLLPNRVLVHCQQGRDRTGLVIGAYRIMFQGWEVAEVNRERGAYGVEGLVKVLDMDMDAVLAEIYRRVHA